IIRRFFLTLSDGGRILSVARKVRWVRSVRRVREDQGSRGSQGSRFARFVPQGGIMTLPFEIDRRAFIASLGGAAAVAMMDHEARAEALEEYTEATLDDLVDQNQGAQGGGQEHFPTVAEIEAQIDTRPSRRGAGNLFVARSGNVSRLERLPAKPTLVDFFK